MHPETGGEGKFATCGVCVCVPCQYTLTLSWKNRGGKFTYWDGGVRIQAFLYSPRRDLIPASMVGAQWTGLAHTVDVMPTFFAAAGLDFDRYSTYSGDDATIRANFDGLNLLHAIQTNASSPRSEVVHMINNEYNHAICDETTGVGGQNHCGAAITTSDGFKLLLGYPGTDIWERPPSNEEAHAVCDAEAFMQNTCLHVFKDQLSNFSSSDPSKCCGACSANLSCGSWTLKADVCYLKTVGAAESNKDQQGCTSGIVRGQPANACNLTSGIGCPCNPPSRGCLFHLPTDPNEHKDLSSDPAFFPTSNGCQNGWPSSAKRAWWPQQKCWAKCKELRTRLRRANSSMPLGFTRVSRPMCRLSTTPHQTMNLLRVTGGETNGI
eukprot:COSAG02_NODE_1218_length_13814_cov_250.988844_2_plen_380_part_00